MLEILTLLTLLISISAISDLKLTISTQVDLNANIFQFKDKDSCTNFIKYKEIILDNNVIDKTVVKSNGVLYFIASLSKCGYNFSLNNNTQGILLQDRLNILPKIPKIIHQSWKNENISLHSKVAVSSKLAIEKFASDFLYILWTDIDIIDLINKQFLEYKLYFRQLNMNIKRADMSRYFIVYKFGGLYLDLDIELRSPAELLINSPKYDSPSLQFISYRSKEFEMNRKVHFAGNALFGSTPHSNILLIMFNHILRYPIQRGRSVDQVLRHTGPLGLGEAIKLYLLKNTKASDMFYSTKFLKRDTIFIFKSSYVGNFEDNPKYAVHIRTHVWS